MLDAKALGPILRIHRNQVASLCTSKATPTRQYTQGVALQCGREGIVCVCVCLHVRMRRLGSYLMYPESTHRTQCILDRIAAQHSEHTMASVGKLGSTRPCDLVVMHV